MGILLSSGCLRAVASLEGEMGWRLLFMLQWVWPLPLCIGAFFAPESPWNAVRRNQPELAKAALRRLRAEGPDQEAEIEATVAYITHTTELEKAETEGASLLECFKGVNLRRTEVVSLHPTLAS